MRIDVNNKEVEFLGSTVAELLLQVGLTADGCALAVGAKIVPMSMWDSYQLSQNDKVTIIRATQGG